MTSLAWIGTGRMGTALAGRLLAAGHDVVVWNRTASKTASLVEQGAVAAESVSELAGIEFAFITVSTSSDLEEVVTRLVGVERLPRVIVDCSTVSAEASAAVRALAASHGVGFVAAPISGNPHVVAEGNACIVASCPIETFETVRPYLEDIARGVVLAGSGEESRLVKLAHNLYLGIMVQALVEVTSLVEKGGTSRAAFLDFMNGTVLGSDWVRKRTKDLVDLDWTTTFTTELLRKDFDLALAAARSLEVPMPAASTVYQLIQTSIGAGFRDVDFLSLYVQQARNAHLPEE